MAKRKSSDTQTELISFEESLNELQAIVKDLENGSIGLEASLTKFERGVGLLRMCYSTLEAAEQKVSILTKSLDRDEPVLAAFDP
ncbi:MAG: exodeoxyribonuclease VII small subunit, partial [Planctomycetes bacterium]|nr:exodeoxyribonuclease VII small subunit [Planctomycetota bacterium]